MLERESRGRRRQRSSCSMGARTTRREVSARSSPERPRQGRDARKGRSRSRVGGGRTRKGCEARAWGLKKWAGRGRSSWPALGRFLRAGEMAGADGARRRRGGELACASNEGGRLRVCARCPAAGGAWVLEGGEGSCSCGWQADGLALVAARARCLCPRRAETARGVGPRRGRRSSLGLLRASRSLARAAVAAQHLPAFSSSTGAWVAGCRALVGLSPVA